MEAGMLFRSGGSLDCTVILPTEANADHTVATAHERLYVKPLILRLQAGRRIGKEDYCIRVSWMGNMIKRENATSKACHYCDSGEMERRRIIPSKGERYAWYGAQPEAYRPWIWQSKCKDPPDTILIRLLVSNRVM
jgi:hypothetical protein